MIFLVRLLRNRELAEDALQAAFIKLITKSSKYKYPMPFSPWVYRITYNCAVSEMRKAKVQQNFILKYFFNSNKPCQNDALAEISDMEAVEEIKSAIDSLPPKQRAMMILHRYEEMDYEQIAVTVGCGLGSVKYQMGEAYKELEKKLSHLAGGD